MKQVLLKLSLCLSLLWCNLAPASEAYDLADAYRLAADNAPALKQSRYMLDAARQKSHQGRALFLPDIRVEGRLNRLEVEYDRYQVFGVASDPDSRSGEFDQTSYGIHLKQPIFNGSALALYQQAKATISKTEAEYQASQQNLILDVSQGYLDILAAQDNLHFAQAEQKAIAKQLDQTKLRFEVGLVAITGVQEAKARNDQTLASVIAAKRQLAIAKARLEALTGHFIETITSFPESFPLSPPDPADMEDWVALADTHNRQLLAAQSAVNLAKAQAREKQAQRLPVLSLNGSIEKNDFENAFSEAESTDTQVGIQLSLPIFQGGLLYSMVKEAQFQHQSALSALELAKRSAELAVKDAYLSVISDLSRVHALAQAVISSQTALAATRAGVEVGTRTEVDALDSQQQLFRARRDYAQARYEYIINSLRLKAAAGILSETDLMTVNSWLR